jgi:hypothetical protein
VNIDAKIVKTRVFKGIMSTAWRCWVQERARPFGTI